MTKKICKKCLVEFPLDLFYKNKECLFGRENVCKKCRNDHTIKTRDKIKHSLHQQSYYRKNSDKIKQKESDRYYTKLDERKNSFYLARYSISLNDAIELLNKQHGLCKICSSSISLKVKAKNGGHVDHCHTTGKVRGILCSQCNTGLGHFKDNVLNLQKAIEYLHETSKETS